MEALVSRTDAAFSVGDVAGKPDDCGSPLKMLSLTSVPGVVMQFVNFLQRSVLLSFGW